MTREEAIAVLVESKRQNEVMRDNPSTFWASHQMADGVKNTERRIAALDMALASLRPVSREQVEKVWGGASGLSNRTSTKNISKNVPSAVSPYRDGGVQISFAQIAALP